MPSNTIIIALASRGHDARETDCARCDQSRREPCRARRKVSSQETSDQALIESIADGDRNAMRVLFARRRVSIFRFVLRLTGSETLADDIVNEVFLEVWRRADRFEAKSQVSTWLLAIARHKALSALKRRSEAQLDERAAAAIADPTDDPETILDRHTRSAIIKRCLAQLPPTQRQVIDLVYYHSKSVAEVASFVGVPASTVKTRMFYARSRMANLLNEAGLEHAVT
jgi:RNA polymerase sigma-70 factor (ECF subfamily)